METVLGGLEAELSLYAGDPDHVCENKRSARGWGENVQLWEECLSVEGGNTGRECITTQAQSWTPLPLIEALVT